MIKDKQMQTAPKTKSLYQKPLSAAQRKSMEDYFVYIANTSPEDMDSDSFTRGNSRAPKSSKYIPRFRYDA